LEHSLRANPINNEKHFIVYSTGPMWKLKCAIISYKNITLTKGTFLNISPYIPSGVKRKWH
jgi:hypothetical protein